MSDQFRFYHPSRDVYMNNGEAYDSLRAEGLTHNQAERELTAAFKGRGKYLGWKLSRGFYVKHT
jgi:hypothetical protein